MTLELRLFVLVFALSSRHCSIGTIFSRFLPWKSIWNGLNHCLLLHLFASTSFGVLSQSEGVTSFDQFKFSLMDPAFYDQTIVPKSRPIDVLSL